MSRSLLCVLVALLLAAASAEAFRTPFTGGRGDLLRSLLSEQTEVAKPQKPSFQNITVSTQFGDVVGAVYQTANAFYQLPYAQPPVGSMRWVPPQPWTQQFDGGLLDGTRYGPACPQDCDQPPFTCPYAGYSEDCLTVAIYQPLGATPSSNLPVMVFIHGGNFIQGGAGTILYNGDYIANNTNTVVVVIQYRLGALAWFLNDDVPGNLGIMDQQMSLKWVQDNIASFGGDPNQVTIFGQSAGGASVAIHMTSPDSQGLFQNAIMESNPITLSPNVPFVMTSLSENLAAALNCSYTDMNCLRNATADAVVAAQNAAIEIYPKFILSAFMPWQPYIDGQIIPKEPLIALNQGEYQQDIPFIAGTVNDEARMFIWEAFPDPVPYDEFLLVIAAIFTEVAPQVIAEYPVPMDQRNDTRDVMDAIGKDYMWICPTRQALRNMTANFGSEVYYYHFNHSFTNFDPWGPLYQECVGYVCHGSELPYVFNSAEIGDEFTGYVWSSDEAKLANTISTMWGNFAHSSSPNNPITITQEPDWPLYATNPDQDYQFATPECFIEQGYRSSQCDFWDSLTNSDGYAYQWGVNSYTYQY